MKTITHVDPYAERRRGAYPEVGEQLDAIWKALAELPSLPPDALEMLERIRQIKTTYPKPRDSGASALEAVHD
ncbi:hypothetical protein [Chromobacterium haemolyticum]|uniref:hypothetical protein n=1 Tax=Chromobacterium haemolyticum TaxID=394935 RepID=UPI0013178E83|nr:hypothetical protein [Chromobacterium haemolyticum]BBH12927.1 hypothetical protein CH06BL_21750 [Chromobacterium haemolyticum]